MSLNVLFNGSNYIIPETGEVGWGGNTTSYLVAIAAGALQKTGGSFTLSAETDFGASFGLKSLYYKSRSSNIADAGILRLNNNSDAIAWRNAANSGNLLLFPNASNLLTYNGSTVYVLGAGTITNADISPSAGIVYSKLNLTNSIVNADVNTSAAIAYSKLNLVGSIVNADVNAAAAIAYSKLNLSNSIVNADVNAAAAIAYSKLNLTGSIVNADVHATAAIALTKLAATTVSRMLVSDTSGFIVPSAWGYNATADLTTGAQDELRFQDAAGGDYVAFRAPAAVTTHTYDLPIAPGTAGQVLSWQAGGQLQWINAAGGGTINSGTQYEFGYYAANGTTISGLPSITTNATGDLVVTNNGSAGAETIRFGTNSGLYTGGTASLRIAISGVERFSVDSSTTNSSGAVFISPTTNQIRLGTTNTTTLTAPTPAASSVYTIPDVGVTASFVMTEAAQTINGIKTFGSNTIHSGTILNSAGSASLPAYSYSADPNTGEYNPSADAIAWATGGTGWWQLGSTGTLSVLTTNAANKILNSDGSASLPSWAFEQDQDTGAFRAGTNIYAIATAGVERIRFTTNTIIAATGSFGIELSSSGGTVTGYAYNSSNTASSDGLLLAQVAGASGGNPMIGWSIPSGTIPEWRMGSNNTAGDVLTLSRGTALGTNNVFTVNSSSVLDFTNSPTTPLATTGTQVPRYSQVGTLQTVQATSTTAFSTTSTSFVSTNSTASITPSSTLNKVLVMAMGVLQNNAAATDTYYTIDRDGNNLGNGTDGFGRGNTGGGSYRVPCTITYLDSPATTSSTTYTVQVRVNGSTGGWGITGTQSLILMEINGN